jgi:hypothetical protein
MTQQAWHTRAEPANIAQQHVITQPGKCTSIDQMESPVPGFIEQLKVTKSSTKSHTQLQKNKLCSRFPSAPVLKKYTGYWIHSVTTEGEQVL